MEILATIESILLKIQEVLMKTFVNLVLITSLSSVVVGCKSPSKVTSNTVDGVTTTTVVDPEGNTTTSTTGSTSVTVDGVTTTTTFDGNGNSSVKTSGISSVTANGITTTTIIDGNGNTATIISGSTSSTIDGVTTTTTIDGQGNTVTTTAGTLIETVDGITTVTVIDGNGQRTVTTSGTQSETLNGIKTTTIIDGNGNRVSTTSGETSETIDGITTTTTFDANGNLVTTTSGSSSVTVDGVTTTTTLDGNGNTVTVVTADPKTTSVTEDGVTVTTTDDGKGNITTVTTTDPKTTVVTEDGITTTTTDDGNGNITTITSGSSSVTVNGVTTTTTLSEDGSKTVTTTSTSSVIETKVGIFVDSLVQGLNYQTVTYSGKTNINGEFDYIDGETVTFSIGDISFSSSVPSTGVVTPLTVFKTTNTSDLAVLNLARLLQSLDADRDNSNGIAISEVTHTFSAGFGSLDFNVSFNDFDTAIAELLTNEGITSLVSDEDAKTHLETSITEAAANLMGSTTTDTTVNTDETGNVTTTTTAADGTITTTITKIDGTTVTTTALPAAVDNLGNAGGVWRGIFTNNNGGITTFYKVFITPSRQMVMLSDSEASFAIQGSDMLQSTAFTQTSDGITINLTEYTKENDRTAPVDVVITGNLTPQDNIKGTYTRGAETGTVVFIYDPIYERGDRVPFFYTSSSLWTLSKTFIQDNVNTEYAMNLFVNDSFRTQGTESFITYDYTIEITDENGDTDTGRQFNMTFVPEDATDVSTNFPILQADSQGCNYDGNLDIVDTHYFIYNLTLSVTGPATCLLTGEYSGLATLEEEYTIIDHPHTHYRFMTFGVSDGENRTINNRMTFNFTGLQ